MSRHQTIRAVVLNLPPPEDRTEFALYVRILAAVANVDPSYVRSIISEVRFDAEPDSIREFAMRLRQSDMLEPTWRYGYHVIVNVSRYARDNPELRKALEEDWLDRDVGDMLTRFVHLYANKKDTNPEDAALKLAKETGDQADAIKSIVEMLSADYAAGRIPPLEAPTDGEVRDECLTIGCTREDYLQALAIWQEKQEEGEDDDDRGTLPLIVS